MVTFSPHHWHPLGGQRPCPLGPRFRLGTCRNLQNRNLRTTPAPPCPSHLLTSLEDPSASSCSHQWPLCPDELTPAPARNRSRLPRPGGSSQTPDSCPRLLICPPHGPWEPRPPPLPCSRWVPGRSRDEASTRVSGGPPGPLVGSGSSGAEASCLPVQGWLHGNRGPLQEAGVQTPRGLRTSAHLQGSNLTL